MTHIGRGQKWAGSIFIAIGAGILLAEIGLHWYMAFTNKKIDPNHWDIFIAFVFIFGGWYTLVPKSAKEGTQFVVDNSIKVIQAVGFKLGRRKSDAMKIVGSERHHTEEIMIPLVVEPDPPGSPQRRASDTKQTPQEKDQ